jgi:hypothetical protein
MVTAHMRAHVVGPLEGAHRMEALVAKYEAWLAT